MKQRKPNRLKGYDYSQDNLYFVTSCVHDMICCFGDVVVGTGRDLFENNDGNVGTGRDLSLREPQMILNEYGKIAHQQWYWLAEQYPYIILHEFIVMPNHIHGIIEINRNAVGTGHDLSGNNDDNAGTGHDLPLQKIKSLSGLMGACKTTVSKKIHLAGYDEFTWQRSFYDHIIRDEKSYERISNYIIDNPRSWKQDKFFNVRTGRDLSVFRDGGVL
jgi:putative transposase